MSEKNDNKPEDRRLSDVVRERKIAAAEREDVVVDMKEADKARLALLAEEIQPLADDIDESDDRFDFTISPGEQPRYWIDSVSHVHMGRDKRTYRFVRDTRLGRIVLSETGDLKSVADHVADYIADRVIEREKMLEGDHDNFKDYYAKMTGERLGKDAPKSEAESPSDLVDEKLTQPVSAGLVVAIIWFIIGSVLGLALAVNYYDQIINFIQSF